MSDVVPMPEAPQVDAVLCLDAPFYERYQAVLRYLCVGLIDLVASVRLVTAAHEVQSLALGPVQTVLHKTPCWPLRTARLRELLDNLSARPPTVVHALSAGSYGVAEQIAQEFDVDVLYHITGLDDLHSLRPHGEPGTWHALCASEPLHHGCLEVPGMTADTVSLVRPGLPCAPEPACFSGDPHQPTILCTAPLAPDEGVDRILRAVRLVRDAGHDVLAFLVGSGPQERALRRLAAELGLGAYVVFAHPQGDVGQVMEGADLLINATVERYVSVPVLLGLAYGLAVVSIAGGVSDACRADETAVLCPSAAPTDLAEGMIRLLQDHDLARRLGTQAIAHMRAHHAISAGAEQTAALYRTATLHRATIPLAAREAVES